MNQIGLVLLIAVIAGLLHLARFWPRLAIGIVLVSTAVLVLSIEQASSIPLDIFGITLSLEPAARDYLAVGLGLTGVLAVATIFLEDRVSLSFLFWSWVPWLIALVVNDFVVGVFAWALGFIAAVFAMKPRKYLRASGAAYFLVVIVIATFSLLLANRFVILYPLTPEDTSLIQFAVLFLCWGFGLAFALFPFQFWLGPMADDAPLTTTAAILALGQPIGLVLLFRFLNQNPWLSDKSNLFELMALGGIAASVVGGLMVAVERRAGRLLGYAGVFTFGFALLDLSRASQEGLAYSLLEVLSRAVGLTALACAVTIGQRVDSPAARRVALAGTLLAGFSLVGLRLGVGLAERWNALLQIAATDSRLMVLLLLAHMGLLVGVVRFTRNWWVELERGVEPQGAIGLAAEQVPVLQGDNALVPVATLAPKPASTNGGKEPEKEPSLATVESAPQTPGSPSLTGPGVELALEKDNAVQEKGRGAGNGGPAQDYVFEEHVREIVKTIAERSRPYLRRAARSLPAGTIAVLVRVWGTWRVSVGIGLVLVVIGLLLAISLVPGAWFDHAIASLGHPPIVQ